MFLPPITVHIVQRLIDGEPIDAAIAAERAASPISVLAPQSTLIARCFSAASVSAILANLDDEGRAGSDFARSAAHAMRSKSPTSFAIALRQMQIGTKLGIEEALRTEFRIVSRIVKGQDFYEGVRAVIIDKDNRPRWNPPAIESLNSSYIDLYFAPLGGHELDFTPQAAAQ